MHYIVGLGNPGEKYVNTRHNVGRDLLLHIAEVEHMGEWSKSKGANALYVRGNLDGNYVELLLPETFMNNSGESVLYLKNKHDMQPSELIVVYDDVALPVGEVKVSKGKGSGGHNGIESITKAIKTKDFARIRIGVASKSFWTGKPVRPTGDGMSKHVLGKFSGKEKKLMEEAVERAYGALRVILKDGIEKAMNECN